SYGVRRRRFVLMRHDVPPVATSRRFRSQVTFSADCRQVATLGTGFCRAHGQHLKILRSTRLLISSTTKPSPASGIQCGTSRFWPSFSRSGTSRSHEPRKVWFIGRMFTRSLRQFRFAVFGIILLTVAIRLPSLLHPLPIDDEAGYSVIANEIVDGVGTGRLTNLKTLARTRLLRPSERGQCDLLFLEEPPCFRRRQGLQFLGPPIAPMTVLPAGLLVPFAGVATQFI